MNEIMIMPNHKIRNVADDDLCLDIGRKHIIIVNDCREELAQSWDVLSASSGRDVVRIRNRDQNDRFLAVQRVEDIGEIEFVQICLTEDDPDDDRQKWILAHSEKNHYALESYYTERNWTRLFETRLGISRASERTQVGFFRKGSLKDDQFQEWILAPSDELNDQKKALTSHTSLIRTHDRPSSGLDLRLKIDTAWVLNQNEEGHLCQWGPEGEFDLFNFEPVSSGKGDKTWHGQYKITVNKSGWALKAPWGDDRIVQQRFESGQNNQLWWVEKSPSSDYYVIINKGANRPIERTTPDINNSRGVNGSPKLGKERDDYSSIEQSQLLFSISQG